MRSLRSSRSSSSFWRKTLIQQVWRPGDNLKRQEKEYRFVGEPEWIYQPDDVQVPVVNRVAKVAAANPAEKPAANDPAKAAAEDK